MLLLSLGRLRLREPQLLQQLLGHVRLRLHLFNDQNTTNLLHGLALLGHRPPEELAQQLLDHSASLFYMCAPVPATPPLPCPWDPPPLAARRARRPRAPC